MSPSFASSPDRRRAMPDHAGARLDGVRAAIETLRREERRLEQLGLAGALRECRRELRYWEFLGALFSLPEAPTRLRQRVTRWLEVEP